MPARTACATQWLFSRGRVPGCAASKSATVLLGGAPALTEQQVNVPEAHLALLADTTPAPDTELPNTGVGLAMERVLSPICIRTPAYGTRNSTWLRIARDGVYWHEQDYNEGVQREFELARLS